jgi:hypothetical protein
VQHQLDALHARIAAREQAVTALNATIRELRERLDAADTAIKHMRAALRLTARRRARPKAEQAEPDEIDVVPLIG